MVCVKNKDSNHDFKSKDLYLISFDGAWDRKNVIKNLKECNYDGPITMELSY